jgi:hypothetical protein
VLCVCPAFALRLLFASCPFLLVIAQNTQTHTRARRFMEKKQSKKDNKGKICFLHLCLVAFAGTVLTSPLPLLPLLCSLLSLLLH